MNINKKIFIPYKNKKISISNTNDLYHIKIKNEY